MIVTSGAREARFPAESLFVTTTIKDIQWEL